MKHRPWLRYVHWLGYITSCLLILEVLVLVYLGLAERKRREADAAFRREATRMQPGSAYGRLAYNIQAYAGEAEEISLLEQLPPPLSLAPDGFRIIARPSFGDTDFAISFRRTPLGGEGIMLMTGAGSDGTPVQTLRLKLSPAVYDELTARLDALASSWKGESVQWTDGTGIVFERVKENSITSAIGDSPNFHSKVGALVFDAVRPTTPQLARFDSSWRPKNQ
jgi:hypothetical protein